MNFVFITIIIIIIMIAYYTLSDKKTVEKFGGFYKYPWYYRYPRFFSGCVDSLRHGKRCYPPGIFGSPFLMSYNYVPSYDIRDYLW